VKIESKGDQHIFEIQVCLHGLDPKTVRVELYADGINGGSPVRQEMTLLHPLADEAGSYIYSATVAADRSAGDYTARLLPHYEGVEIPLEDPRILWQH
jgi:starch phosphorylase